MYTSFYNLSEIPFTISTDPRFLWCGKKHREALANLRSGLLQADGHVVLTGDIGTGKTTLVNALLKTLDSNVLVASICHPTLSSLDFFNLIAHAFGTAAEITSKTQFLSFIKRLLQQSRREGKTVLLIIDEAHFLPEELFEDIWFISTIEEEGSNLLTVFFIGQQELKEILQRPRHSALRRRIALFCEIDPLSEQETLEYVAHRLKVAGAVEQVFSSAAIRQVHRFSLGYPRLINILCSRAMLAGSINDQRQIDTTIVSRCIEEMQFLNPLPASIRKQWNTEISTSPPVELIPLGDKEPNPELSQQNGEGIPLQKQETTDDGPRAYMLRMSRRLFRFPLPGLPLLVLIAIAATIGRLSLTGHSNQPQAQHQQDKGREQTEIMLKEKPLPQIRQQPVSAKMDRAIVDPQTIGAPPSGQIEATEEASDKQQPPTPLELAATAVEQDNFQAAMDIMEADGVMEGDSAQQQRNVYVAALVGRAQQIATASPAQALALLLRAVGLDPDNSRAHFRIGSIYTELKEYTAAIAAYRQAQVLNPDYSDALYNLGFVYATVGRYEDAEQMFARVVQLEPEYLDKALFNLAVVQEKLGKNEECLVNARKAAALSPEDQKIRDYLLRFPAAVQGGPQ